MTDGLSSQNQGELLTGAVVVALLAVVVEAALAMVQRRVDPTRALRRNPATPGAGLAAAVEET